jgi:hypothetical protein
LAEFINVAKTLPADPCSRYILGTYRENRPVADGVAQVIAAFSGRVQAQP